ncbi:MAG: ABC transporter ATP-binding protein [Gammaproteobacteria bacterium]
MEPLIRIRNLCKNFGDCAATDDVSLDIYDREFVALLGPSGCGKTTLLRMLGGFETPDGGEITMGGADLIPLPPNRRPLNMVFQSYAVFPHMNVRDNVAYGLKMDGAAAGEIKSRVRDALSLVRLESFAERFSHQLSGGQRQRVALARALVKRPRVLLLDEPLSALDAKLREAMQTELVKLQHAVGITFVVVTHDQDEALSMAERIAVMDDGKIMQLDTPRNLYERPANRFVADFIGRMNILPARRLREKIYAAEGLGEVFAAEDNPRAKYVAVRPAYIRVADEKTAPQDAKPANIFSVTVEGVSYYGGETVLSAKTENGASLSVILPNQSRDSAPPANGEKIAVRWRAEDMITLAE